jgi:trehalose 6-phosphate phosphatase
VRVGKGYKTLWTFDFDGTLSPIVPGRTEARMHPACRSFLGELVRVPGILTAVLSSRTLEDLVSRVPLRGVFLGGGSGLEWRLPWGQRIRPGREAERRVESARKILHPLLEKISSVPGTDIEDKRWSIAVHYRRVSPDERAALWRLLDEVPRRKEVRVYEGPAVMEIQLVPGWEKAKGLENLCRHLRFDPGGGRVVYAGDDENDGTAMRWALSRKGTAFAVGIRPRVPGARSVRDPASLAHAVRVLACLPEVDGGEAKRTVHG